ncbi:hypothetical protein [Nodosilinea nodulosa]|uniref:hypothetical protein n=1 Tax=Nodosilinea nodulosa TaxID=416001 RepID=UPI0012D715FD|nr:hypothetical protein [Nodosilinea nodulosa]
MTTSNLDNGVARNLERGSGQIHRIQLPLVITGLTLGGVACLTVWVNMRSQLAEANAALGELQRDVHIVCNTIRSQGPIAHYSSPGAAMLPTFSEMVAKDFGTDKLEQMCPGSAETVPQTVPPQS